MQEERKNTTMITDLTEGSVPKLLLLFALPLFASNALQAVYNIVDMVVVGQFIGGTGMSAVSTGGDLLHLMTFAAMGFSSAGQVIIARYIGAGKRDRVRKVIGTMFTFLFLISAVLSVLTILLRHTLLELLNTPAEAYGYTLDYTVVCALGLPFIYGYNCVSAILRGMGDSRRPFFFIGIAAVLNMVLDVWFVASLGLAVFGAALATVIGQGASFIASIIYLYRHRESFGFDFRPQSFVLDRQVVKPLVALGVPMAIQSMAINFSKIVLMAWINSYGVIYSALSGIFNKVNAMTGVISQSFTTAGSTMTGQNLGARRFERISRILLTILVFMCGVMTVLALLLLLSPDTLFRLITSDEEVLSIAKIIVIPIIINFYGAATRSAALSLINGSGNPRLNLCIAILDGVVSRIGLAALFGFGLGFGCIGFWYGDAIAGFMPLCIAGVYYLSGRWRRQGA